MRVVKDGVEIAERKQFSPTPGILLSWDELGAIMDALIEESNGEAVMLGNGGTARAISYRLVKQLLLDRKEGKNTLPWPASSGGVADSKPKTPFACVKEGFDRAGVGYVVRQEDGYYYLVRCANDPESKQEMEQMSFREFTSKEFMEFDSEGNIASY